MDIYSHKSMLELVIWKGNSNCGNPGLRSRLQGIPYITPPHDHIHVSVQLGVAINAVPFI
ncbi:hypothetical protein J6590_055474 [Homalodisca vitripennis]|nr:hypothetical protein J6590_055474 [Homalodisca vitripennis]